MDAPKAGTRLQDPGSGVEAIVGARDLVAHGIMQNEGPRLNWRRAVCYGHEIVSPVWPVDA